MANAKRKTASRRAEAQTLKVGDRVRLLRSTRHYDFKAGDVGTVAEVHGNDRTFPGAVSVEFMRLPDPRNARIFGMDPDVPQAYRCMFPADRVAAMIAKES